MMESMLDSPAVRMIQQQEAILSKIVQQQQIAQRVFDDRMMDATNQLLSQYDSIQHLATRPYLDFVSQQSQLINNILPVFSKLSVEDVLEQVKEFESESESQRAEFKLQGASETDIEVTVNNPISSQVFSVEEMERLKEIAKNKGTLKGFLMAVSFELGIDAVKYIITEIFMPILLVLGTFVDDSVENLMDGLDEAFTEQVQYSKEQISVTNEVKVKFNEYVGESNQEFLLRAGRMKSAPVLYHSKIEPFQKVKVVGRRGNWLKVEVETAQGNLSGWVEGYKINKVK